jgi:hypothetical protein
LLVKRPRHSPATVCAVVASEDNKKQSSSNLFIVQRKQIMLNRLLILYA